MSAPERPACDLCKDVAVPIKGGGSVRWERQDSPDRHYMATPPAMRRRQWAGEERVGKLQEQIDAISGKGRVAWVDVKDSGEFCVSGSARADPGQYPPPPVTGATAVYAGPAAPAGRRGRT